MKNKTVRWGILSTGHIARVFAEALATSDTGEVVAVGSRSQAGADAFAARFGVPRAYADYDGVLSDPDVDAVYIATPHPHHEVWAIRAAEAGKHILCEKPLTVTAEETERVLEAVRRHDVFLMEAFMYRCHPQTRRLVELIEQGVIGEVRLIQAAFSFRAPYDPAGRLFAPELGGGGILDVGCYAVSISRMVAGAALGLGRSAEPMAVTGFARPAPTGTDEVACAVARFDNGILAQWSCGVGLEQDNRLVVYGTEGRLVVPVPFAPSKHGDVPQIHVLRTGEALEVLEIPVDRGLFVFEADMAAAHLEDRQAPWPAMTWDDTRGNMRALDLWRAAVDGDAMGTRE